MAPWGSKAPPSGVVKGFIVGARAKVEFGDAVHDERAVRGWQDVPKRLPAGGCIEAGASL